ncbi:MAG: hypothetical protein E6J65_15030 [Deltaproteobacteria bacterium]|nr:MAG: hypothetical protein E6J65_15030 [Deltaproteobacteria bacterium]
MLKTNHKVSKLGLSFGIALLLSGAASAARATPLPTTSDEARPLTANVATQATAVAVPVKGAVSSTDEARALAAFSLPISSATPVASRIVTSTDEARAAAGGDRLVPVEIERPEESRAVANRVEHH